MKNPQLQHLDLRPTSFLTSIDIDSMSARFIWIAILWRFVAGGDGPTKVFILSGQSNMVGMARIDHLKLLINASDCACNEYRRSLWDDLTNSFKVRDDVFLKFGDVFQGNLTVNTKGRTFGPEIMFGWEVGDALPGNLYLVKAAYGGRSLAVDFRPPSSGTGPYGPKPVHYGWEYRQMITDILDDLNHIADVVPGYDPSEGYELAGFVWFQGWNDMLCEPCIEEYAFNLANFIRDVRLDLEAPNLPFIVGELGMHGLHPTGSSSYRVLGLRAAQENVPLLPEFRDTSLFVHTALYAFPNATAEWGAIYHYFGRADTYFHIGQAFGRGMLSLMNNATSQPTRTKKGNPFLWRSVLSNLILRQN